MRNQRAKISKSDPMKPIIVKTGYVLAAAWSCLLVFGGILMLVYLLSWFCASREMDETTTHLFILGVGAILGVPPLFWTRAAIFAWTSNKLKAIDAAVKPRSDPT